MSTPQDPTPEWLRAEDKGPFVKRPVADEVRLILRIESTFEYTFYAPEDNTPMIATEQQGRLILKRAKEYLLLRRWGNRIYFSEYKAAGMSTAYLFPSEHEQARARGVLDCWTPILIDRSVTRVPSHWN